MSEIKIEIKTEVNSQTPEDFSTFEQVEENIIKLECPNLTALSENNEEAETTDNENVAAETVKDEAQAEYTEVPDCIELEQTSSGSPEESEFTAVSLDKDDMENIIICVGNEYAYNHCPDLEKDDSCKRESYNSKRTAFYKDLDRRNDDDYESDRNFSSRRIIDKSIKSNERLRSRDNNYTKYSPDKTRSTYYSNSHRRSRSSDRSRSRYISSRSRRSRSFDKSRRYRESRSPPYRSRRRRRRSRSRSHSRSYARSRSRSRSRSYIRSHSRSQSRSHIRSRSRSRSNISSPKQILNKRDSSTKKDHSTTDSPPRNNDKLTDHPKCPDNWTVNNQKAKSPAPESPSLCNSQPPLPKSPPPPKPPPPIDNYMGILRPPIAINQVPNIGFSPRLWVNQKDRNIPQFFSFINPSMPRVSVNNLPLVPGLGNLPVHITPTGEQILHDMEGRPIPLGPNGRLLPLDMFGRLVPHIEFMFNDQAVPICMTNDGVLRLPNGEPVPYGDPNKLPVNIDGSIIPIGPDSRPLYKCPNIPVQNNLISPQAGSPAIPCVDLIGSQQEAQTNSSPNSVVNMNSNVNGNVTSNNPIQQVQPSSTIIEIPSVLNFDFQNKKIPPEVINIEMKTSWEEENKFEEVAATKTQSAADVEKPRTKAITEGSVKAPKENKVIKRQLYENVDLNKLVEKFSTRVSKQKIRTIYQKKIERSLRERMRRETEIRNSANEKLGPAQATVENKLLFTVQNEDLFSRSDENSPNSKKDIGLSEEEAFCENKFNETILEAISLFADIDFTPPALGRFLFSKSQTYPVSQSPPNASPLTRHKIKLPFLSHENLDSSRKKKKSRNVNFRFLPERDGKSLDRTTMSLAVQCDFTSKKFQNLCGKIDLLKKELFRCKNENAELKDLHKSLEEENKKKTEELNKAKKIIEEKNKLIKDLTQPRRQFWA